MYRLAVARNKKRAPSADEVGGVVEAKLRLVFAIVHRCSMDLPGKSGEHLLMNQEEIRDLNSRGMESDRQFRLRQQTSAKDELPRCARMSAIHCGTCQGPPSGQSGDQVRSSSRPMAVATLCREKSASYQVGSLHALRQPRLHFSGLRRHRCCARRLAAARYLDDQNGPLGSVVE